MLKLRRRGWRAGFTLAELTVVSGILSNLAGTSGSAFLQAQNKALQAPCASQLQQIYQLMVGMDEEGGRLPLAWTFPWKQDPNDRYSIVNIVAGRNASVRKLFVCPAAPEPWKQLGITYVYNDALGGKLVDNLPNAANTWLMMDAAVLNMKKFPASHVGGYNVLFCDGHVKWIPQSAITQYWRAPIPPEPETEQPSAGGMPTNDGQGQQQGGQDQGQ